MRRGGRRVVECRVRDSVSGRHTDSCDFKDGPFLTKICGFDLTFVFGFRAFHVQAATTRLAFQPVVSNVRLGDVIRNDQTFNFSSTIGFVMRFELTRNSYTIVKCATHFTVNL